MTKYPVDRMKLNGYKYYVYLCPGNISYFMDYELAQEYAIENNAEVQKV